MELSQELGAGSYGMCFNGFHIVECHFTERLANLAANTTEKSPEYEFHLPPEPHWHKTVTIIFRKLCNTVMPAGTMPAGIKINARLQRLNNRV
jgi:hypothetical protein